MLIGTDGIGPEHAIGHDVPRIGDPALWRRHDIASNCGCEAVCRQTRKTDWMCGDPT